MKFKDAIPMFLFYKKDYVSENTISGYDALYRRHLIPYFGEFETLTKDDVNSYVLLKSKEGIAKSGLQDHVVALKTFARWGNRTGNFKTKPFKVSYPIDAVEKIKIKPFTVEEAKCFINFCEENFSFINFTLMIGVFTGLRAGELCALKWKDIDEKKGVVYVSKTASRVKNIFKANHL